MNRFIKALGALVAATLFIASGPAFAAPLSYVNSPLDTPQALVNTVVSNINSTMTSAQPLVLATASSNAATMQGSRLRYTTASLTTAASAVSTAQTITDASVVASSQVMCQTTGYAGAGAPLVIDVVPAAGSFTFQIYNATVSAAALNAVVVVDCLVFN